MHEFLHISQVFLWRYPYRHAILLTCMLFASVSAFLGPTIVPPQLLDTTLSICSLTLIALPLTIYTYGDDIDFANRDSGFPRWWFALPLRSSSLAWPPIILLAISLSFAWCMIQTWCRHASMPIRLPILGPVLFVIGVGSWTQWISWKPTANVFRRLGGFFGLLFAFGLIAIVGFGGFGTSPSVIFCLLVAFATTGIWKANLAADQSRHGFGTVAISIKPSVSGEVDELAAPVSSLTALGKHQNEIAALLWNDWTEIGKWYFGLCSIFIALCSLAFISTNGLLIPLFIPSVLSLASTSHLGLPHFFRPSIHYPVHLAVLPTKTFNLVLARFVVIGASSFVLWAIAAIVTAGMLLNPSSRDIAQQFVFSMDEAHGTGSGYRLIAAIVLLSLVLPVAFSLSGLWLSMFGKSWVSSTIVGVVSFSIFGPLIYLIFRVMTVDGMRQFVDQLPWLQNLALDTCKVLACIKLATFLISWTWATQSQLIAKSLACRIVAISLAVVVGLSSLFGALTPSTIVDIKDILAGVVLVAPLSAFALCNLALARNRHR